jgi:hypothetical protein
MRLAGLGTIDAVAQAIQQQEGYYPGSLAYTNNNPGNLRYAGQASATQGAGGFAAFPDYAAGYQALLNQISLDASRGLTILQFTSKYAPAADGNNPNAYAVAIANATGLTINDPLAGALSDATMPPLDGTVPVDASASATDPAMIALAVGGALLLAWWLR